MAVSEKDIFLYIKKRYKNINCKSYGSHSDYVKRVSRKAGLHVCTHRQWRADSNQTQEKSLLYADPHLRRELIGINETWFRNRGYIRGEINLDDFKNAGAYSLFNVEGNNVPTSWAQLLIFSSGYYIIQIIVDISSRKLFIRRYDTENDRWQEWGNIIIT